MCEGKFVSTEGPPTVRLRAKMEGEERPTLMLWVKEDASGGLAFPLREGRWVIGRASTAHVRLSCSAVSREHAVVEVAPDGEAVVRRLSRTNPLWVDGADVEERVLRRGDWLRVGHVRIEVVQACSPELTPRELDVAHGVAEGLTNIAIGRRLRISPRTVSTHLSNIYGRIGVRTRAGLATYVMRRGHAGLG